MTKSNQPRADSNDDEDEKEGVSRRDFLGVSTGAAVGGALAAGAIGGATGYLAGSQITQPENIEQLEEQIDALNADLQNRNDQIEELQTQLEEKGHVTAGFIYVGPVADFGWTAAHDAGRQGAEEILGDSFDSFIQESVPETEAGGAIDSMVDEGADVVFTTSFGFMQPTVSAAERHPDVRFEHCSGFTRRENLGTYFGEFYQIYYLNGLAAGAVTNTDELGYVAAFLTPEVVRHINAYAIGAREVNPDATVHVVRLGAWFDPSGARQSTETLIETEDADVIAYTEDTPEVLRVCQEHQEEGDPRWSFSHYSDMRDQGPDAHLTGQIVDWTPMYVEILSELISETWESRDRWWRVGDGMNFPWKRPSNVPPDEPVERNPIGTPEGAVYPAPLSNDIPSETRQIIADRYEQMKELLFEPFIGPLANDQGQQQVQEGVRLGRDPLWAMNWFVEGVESTARPQ